MHMFIPTAKIENTQWKLLYFAIRSVIDFVKLFEFFFSMPPHSSIPFISDTNASISNYNFFWWYTRLFRPTKIATRTKRWLTVLVLRSIAFWEWLSHEAFTPIPLLQQISHSDGWNSKATKHTVALVYWPETVQRFWKCYKYFSFYSKLKENNSNSNIEFISLRSRNRNKFFFCWRQIPKISATSNAISLRL